MISKDKKTSIFKLQKGRFSRLRSISYRLDWIEDTFLNDLSTRSNDFFSKNFKYTRIYVVLSFFVFMILVLILRAMWLQIYKGQHYSELATNNRIRLQRIEARRGLIYDKNNFALVRNVANFMLYVVPNDLTKLENKDLIIQKIVNILDDEDINLEFIEDLLNSVKPNSLELFQPLFVLDDIEYKKALKLYLESQNWPGVYLESKTRRSYNLTSLSLSHILGYTGKINNVELERASDDYLPIDYIGKVGLEYFWESELRGINGQKQVEVDALGQEKRIIKEQPAINGKDLVISIDVGLQKKIEEILNEHLSKNGLSRAVVIALNPNNGEVLALVNIPSYNNNTFARGITQDEYSYLINHPDNPLFNRAVSGEYPSGSTIKPVMVSAALEENVVSEYTSFYSSGGIGIGQWYFPDWKAGGHGPTDARKAIAESVNTYFYYIGGGYKEFRGMGVDKITKYGRMFGLDAQTGIDLAGESDGFLPSKQWKKAVKGERWYIGDTYHLAIGQGDVLVTPLQVANFANVFANGGILYRPHIVSELIDSETGEKQAIDATPVRQDFIKKYNIVVARQGMRNASTKGSARMLSSLTFTSGGKTGTAQWSSVKETHAWFIGFAPYIDPEITLAVLVEEGGEGSAVAVPIAYDIFSYYVGKN